MRARVFSGILKASLRQVGFNRLVWVFIILFFFAAGSGEVSGQGGQAARPNFREDQVIVIPKKGIRTAALQQAHLKSGRRLVRSHPRLGGIQVVKLRPGETVGEAIQELRGSGLVEAVEPDFILRAEAAPNDPEFVSGIQWALRNTGQNGGVPDADIAAVEAWDTIHYASNVVVAVVDSGIRYTHEDLAGNMWVNPGEIAGNGLDDDGNGIVDDVHGLNAIFETGEVMDDNGHGSHVAGVIGAVGNNGKGISGVAWGVQLMACKFLDSVGDGDISDAIQCLEYALEQGVDVVNASFGGDQFSMALFTAFEKLRDAGVIVVAAAGNNSRDIDLIPNYPASFDLENIVSVCAISRYNTLDTGYSNYGATTVDLAAPGTSIYSTWHSSDKAYSYLSGTSMATPLVAGAFALLKARYPEESATQLIARMIEGAEPVAALEGKCITGARMNLANALGEELVADFRASQTVGEAPLSVTFTNLSLGQVAAYEWDFGDGSEPVVEAEPEHVFAEAGEYTVTLNVAAPNGQVESKQTMVRVVRNYEFVPEPFAWVELTNGTRHELGDDGVSAPVEIGFPFALYGEEFASVRISANGLIGLGTGELSGPENIMLPDESLGGAVIAPYWDDLNLGTTGVVQSATFGEAPGRRLVVSWEAVVKNSNGAPLTFQAILEEGSNEVVFQYLDVAPEGNQGVAAEATIGVQETRGEVGSVYTHDGQPFVLGNRQALRARLLDYSYLGVSPREPEPFRQVSGEPVQPEERIITLRNAGTVPLEWRGAVTNEWISVAPGEGVLGPGVETSVMLTLGAGAGELEAGEYLSAVLFENLRDGQGTRFVNCEVKVAAAMPVLMVVTNDAPYFTGGVGGPFSPAAWSCVVSNSGNAGLSWKVSSSASWLSLPEVGQELAPGESREVQINLGPEATALEAGLYTADLHFLNLEIGEGNTTVSLALSIRSGLQAYTTGQVDFGTFKLSVAADPGSVQVIERSTDLAEWSAVYTNKIDEDGVFELWFPTSPQEREFFRVRELR